MKKETKVAIEEQAKAIREAHGDREGPFAIGPESLCARLVVDIGAAIATSDQEEMDRHLARACGRIVLYLESSG